MEITLVPIRKAEEICSEELRERTQQSSKSRKTVWYCALHVGEEVAFVAIDPWPEFDHMVLYELFIPKSLRRQGIGTAVLAQVEIFAADKGFSAIRVNPSPLDTSIDMSALENWYRKCGYQRVKDMNDMEKDISYETHQTSE